MRSADWLAPVLLALILAAVCACTHAPAPPQNAGGTGCASMCANLEAMGCTEGRGTRDGISCTDACMRIQAYANLIPTACEATAKSCDAATRCPIPEAP